MPQDVDALAQLSFVPAGASMLKPLGAWRTVVKPGFAAPAAEAAASASTSAGRIATVCRSRIA